tara:strand:+ start:200 stop:529 length:330 start_codon:yes stop_codon:yes gene_type:complete
MQTTDLNDSMMTDFYQVGGYSSFGGGLKRAKEKLEAKVEEKKRQQALEIKRLLEEEEKLEQQIINEQNVLKNQVIDTPSPQADENKTPYLWIGLGAVVLVGITILIVKK